MKYDLEKTGKVSDILNEVYDKIGRALGVDMDNDSDIFYEIEEFIVKKYQEMQDEIDDYEETCGFCGDEIEKTSNYCSKECSVADNTEGV